MPTKTEKVELEKNGRVITGFDINRHWDDRQLEKELATLLCGSLEGVGFEIMKNSSGTLLRPNIPTGKKIDAKLLLKSIAPSGCIYLRPLFEIKSEPADDMFPEDDVGQLSEHTDIVILPTATPPPVTNVNTSEVVDLTKNANDTCDPTVAAEPSSLTLSSGSNSGTNIPNVDDGIPAESTCELATSDVPSLNGENPTQFKCLIDIQSIINTAKCLNLIHPIEVIRYLQQEIVTGRMLDVASHEETIDGDTNYITVDRDNIMETTFSEFQFIDDFTKTFQVDFMGEESVDLGGPRKEWIRLIN